MEEPSKEKQEGLGCRNKAPSIKQGAEMEVKLIFSETR